MNTVNEVFERGGWYIFEVVFDGSIATHVAAQSATDALRAYTDDTERTDLFGEVDKGEELSLSLRIMTVSQVEGTMVLMDEDAAPSDAVSLRDLFLLGLGEALALQKEEGTSSIEPFVIASTLP